MFEVYSIGVESKLMFVTEGWSAAEVAQRYFSGAIVGQVIEGQAFVNAEGQRFLVIEMAGAESAQSEPMALA